VLCCALAGAGAILLAACSSGGAAPAAAISPKASATASAAPAATTPTPSLSGALTVSITGLAPTPSLGYGSAPLQFTVTLSNGSSSTYSNIMPIVYLAPCTCVNSPAPADPQGTMQVEDASTGQWQSVFYDHEGGGTDYLQTVQQFPGITLGPGATESYTLRLAFDALSQQGDASVLAAGHTSIDATVVTLPGHTVIGSDPAATIPLSVTTG
jgi:hypothetical protein